MISVWKQLPQHFHSIKSLDAAENRKVRIRVYLNEATFIHCQAYSEMIAERRKRVTSGVEDTFGRKKKQ